MPSATSPSPNAQRLLITGGSGFIGSALVSKLLESDANHVLNLDVLSYAANPESLASIQGKPNYQFQRVNICDREVVSQALEQFQPDLVIHLAAESHVDRSIDSPQVFLDTNILGTASILQAIRNYLDKCNSDLRDSFRYLHVSTDEVFGSIGLDDNALKEDAPYRPNSPYAASKAAADHLVRAWAKTYRIPSIITYSCNNFGPRQHPEKLIPTVIHHAINLQPIPIYGNGRNQRDWLHVDDHAAALIQLSEQGQPGEAYNIAAGNELSNNSLAKIICSILDELKPLTNDSPIQRYDELIQHVPDRPGHDFRYVIDSSKLRKLCNWQAQDDFIKQLRDTIQWHLSNPQWTAYFTQGKAQLKRLGKPAPLTSSL